MSLFRIDVHGLPGRGLTRLADGVSDLRPFWAELGRSLADESQRRWPLKRRSGRLRRSLTWAGDRLGRGGVFETSPDALRFGSAVFYSRFFQHATKRRPARPLIHVNEQDHAEQLSTWLRERAAAAGLEVTG